MIARRTDAPPVLDEKARSHRLSARQLLGPAGNFYQASAWYDDLLAQTGFPDPVRHRVEIYVE